MFLPASNQCDAKNQGICEHLICHWWKLMIFKFYFFFNWFLGRFLGQERVFFLFFYFMVFFYKLPPLDEFISRCFQDFLSYTYIRWRTCFFKQHNTKETQWCYHKEKIYMVDSWLFFFSIAWIAKRFVHCSSLVQHTIRAKIIVVWNLEKLQWHWKLEILQRYNSAVKYWTDLQNLQHQ